MSYWWEGHWKVEVSVYRVLIWICRGNIRFNFRLVGAYIFVSFIKSNLHPCIFPTTLGKKPGVVLFCTQCNKLFPTPQMILLPHPYPPIVTTRAQYRPSYIPINSLHITMTLKLSHHLNIIGTPSNDYPLPHLCQLVNPHNPSF